MQMKCDPLNSLLICLVRPYEEVSPAPQTERCPFWTHITHVTASVHKPRTAPPPPKKKKKTHTQSFFNPCFTPSTNFSCIHNL